MSRKFSGELTKAGQEELDRLMEEPDGESEAWELLQDPSVTAEPEEAATDAAEVYWEKHREHIENEQPGEAGRRGAHRWLWPAAACAALLLLFSIGLLTRTSTSVNEKESHFITVRTGANERETFTLPDSSHVTLNQNSYFSYDRNLSLQGNRLARFSGEGYFEIKHNPDAPFLIETPRMQVRVMGTVFNLLASAAEEFAEATLFEGKIEVTLNKDEENERKVILSPEEKLTLSGSSGPGIPVPDSIAAWKNTVQYTVSEIAKPSEENIYKENAWIRGKVVFENDSLGLVAEYLEEKYNVDIVYDNPSISQSRLRGVFRDESLESILEALKFIDAINDYKINGSTVTIY